MRATLVAFLLVGAATMSDAQDKKDEKKPKEPYTEFVMVREWANGRLLDAVPNVSAYRVKDKNGKEMIRLKAGDGANELAPKSEIVTKDGTLVVTKTIRLGPDYACYFEKKPAEKKLD